MNGLQALMAMMSPSPFNAPGNFTSGRRTWLGNQKVGGVQNSNHLKGTAADFTGTDKSSLQNYFGPEAKVGWHDNHWHVDGLEDVPYHGQRGTAGLKNGVDTTMPKSYYPLPKREDELTDAERAARAAAFNIKLPGSVSEGITQSAITGALLPQAVQAEFPEAMAQAGAAQDTKKKHNGLFPGSDAGAIMGILGDALMAYGGLSPSFGPMMAQKNAMEREQELRAERDRIKALQDAQRPPAEVVTAQYWARMQQEDPVGFAKAMAAKDVVSPNYEQVTDPSGYVREVRKDRVETQVLDGVTYYKINGQWVQGGN